MPGKNINVFISSPSDVRPERERIVRVFDKLKFEFDDEVEFSIFFWEDSYYTAREGFQAQIEKKQPLEEVDLFVCILWKTMGKLLPESFCRPDGSHRTGTEYEFETAMDASLKKGIPDILLYRKCADVVMPVDRLQQEAVELQALENFWRQWIRNEQGHFLAGFKYFSDTDDFERVFEKDLKTWVADHHRTATWPVGKGAPYRGLQVFEYEYADIFFGRKRAVKEIRSKLLAHGQHGECSFLLIVGASGSGKSSLVRAGLLPALKTSHQIPGVFEWRYCAIRPSELGDNIVFGLCRALTMADAVPEILEGSNPTVQELEEFLRDAPGMADRPVRFGLSQRARGVQEQQSLKTAPGINLLLLVDQLEEIFHVMREDQDCFFKILRSLSSQHNIWVVATLRSDLYAEMQANPRLVELKLRGQQYDLLAPREHELKEIITGPASMAGLHFEQADSGIGLDELLLDEAKDAPESLPLLEYTLSQLYGERDRDNQLLTLRAYENIGGLRGAIGKKAEMIMKSLPGDVQRDLPRVLLSLVTISPSGRVSARVQPYGQYPAESKARRLVDAFLAENARLLVIQEDSNHEPSIRVAHEALLTHWRRARKIIDENIQDIELRAILEQETQRWMQAETVHKIEYLRQAGIALEEARDLLQRTPDVLSPEVIEFIRLSVRDSERKAKRRTRFLTAVSAVLAFLTVMATAGAWWALEEQSKTKKSQAEVLLNSSIQLAEDGNAALAVDKLVKSIELDSQNPLAVARLVSLLTQRQFPAPPFEVPLFRGKIHEINKSPDNRLLIILSKNHEAAIYDIQKEEKWDNDLTRTRVRQVAFSGDGKFLAAATVDGPLQVWDLKRQQLVKVLDDDPASAIAISENGRYVLGNNLWRVDDASVIRKFDSRQESDLVFADFLNLRDGLLTVNSSGRITVHPFPSSSDFIPFPLLDHKAPVTRAVLSEDKQWLATSDEGSLVKVWNLSAHELAYQLQIDGRISSIGIAENELLCAMLSGEVSRWNLADGHIIAELEAHQAGINEITKYQGKLLTASWDSTARLHGVEQPATEPMRHDATVYAAVPGLNPGEIYTGSVDGVLRQWKYGRSEFYFQSWSSDSAINFLEHDVNLENMIVVSGSGLKLKIFTGMSDTPLVYESAVPIIHAGIDESGKHARWVTSSGEIYSLSLSPKPASISATTEKLDKVLIGAANTDDWGRMIVQYGNRWFRLWNSEKNVPMTLNIEAQSPVIKIMALNDADLLMAAQENGDIDFWDLKTGLPYDSSINIPGISQSIKFRSGRFFFVVGESILVYQLSANFRPGGASPDLKLIENFRHADDVASFDISLDGRLLASSSLDGSINFWDMDRLALRYSVNTGNTVGAMDVSPNGLWLLTGAQDGLVRIVDVKSGLPVADSYKHESRVVHVKFDSIGNRVISASNNGNIHLMETSLHLRPEIPQWLPEFSRFASGLTDSHNAPEENESVNRSWKTWRETLERQING